jgi:zinc D-Ala-D-Ala carboxypeptidase
MAAADQRLSDNFSLHELLASQVATRFGYTEQFNPSPQVIYNLKLLCVHVLQPLRNSLEYPLRVTSGYRCPRLNEQIGGSRNSQHLQGKAADIMDVYNGNSFLLQTIVQMGLPFDQVIDEFGMAWIHVSYDAFRTRQHLLQSFRDEKGRTGYQHLERVGNPLGQQDSSTLTEVLTINEVNSKMKRLFKVPVT